MDKINTANIQDGRLRHLKLKKVLLFLYYPAKPHQIWKERCESYVEQMACVRRIASTQKQNGRFRHLELTNSASLTFICDQFSSNLLGMLRIRCLADILCQKLAQNQKKMVANAILNLQILLPFLYYLTNERQVRRECCESDVQRTGFIEK